MANTFDQIFAADPSNPSNVAQNASITIFAPGDTSMTPLTITDPDGQPLTNPIPVNANGFGSAFAHATLDRVAWAGGGFTGFFTSYEGMKGEAVAAREAAEQAAATAATEATLRLDELIAAGSFEGPAGPLTNLTVGTVEATPGNPLTDDIVASEVTTGTATTAALNATIETQSAAKATTPGNTFYDTLYNNVLFRLKNAADTFLTVTRRLNFTDDSNGLAKGSIINIDHWGNGTAADVGDQTYGLDVHNNPGARPGIMMHQYSDQSAAFQIDNTDNQPAIYVQNTENLTRNPDGIGSGDAFHFVDHGVARFRVKGDGTMNITPTDTAAGHAIEVAASAAAKSSFKATQKGAAHGVLIDADASGGADAFYPIRVNGRTRGIHVTSSVDGAQTVRIEKNALAAGTALYVVNKGTGYAVEINDGTASVIAVDGAGVINFIKANLSTTSATAGAASALPATPSGYLSVKVAGAFKKIPYYDA